MIVGILENEPDLLANGGKILLLNLQSIHPYFSPALQKAQHQPHKGGFSRPVCTDQAHALPFLDGEI